MDLYTLSVDDVVAIYHEICDTTAAPARPEGLESAVAAPFATFGGEYLHADLSTMAAARCVRLHRTKHSWTVTNASHGSLP